MTTSDSLPVPTGDKPKPNRGPGKPFLPGNPGKPRFWTVERVKPALLKAKGNLSHAARLISQAYAPRKCHRETLEKLLKENPDLQKACEEAWAATLDAMEYTAVEMAMAGHDRMLQFMLGRTHPKYRNKQEITGKDGGPLSVGPAIPTKTRPADPYFEGVDMDRLSGVEQGEMAMLAERLDQAGDLAGLSDVDGARFLHLVRKGRGKLLEGE